MAQHEARTEAARAVRALYQPGYDSGLIPVDDIVGVGDMDLTHSLGAAPTRLNVTLVCTTADAAYAVDDVLFAHQLARPLLVVVSETTISLREDPTPQVFNKNAGTVEVIDTADWSIRVQAWL